MTNEAVSALVTIGFEYLRGGRRVPDHVVADLLDAIRCDLIATSLRNQAQRLLRQVGAA